MNRQRQCSIHNKKFVALSTGKAESLFLCMTCMLSEQKRDPQFSMIQLEDIIEDSPTTTIFEHWPIMNDELFQKVIDQLKSRGNNHQQTTFRQNVINKFEKIRKSIMLALEKEEKIAIDFANDFDNYYNNIDQLFNKHVNKAELKRLVIESRGSDIQLSQFFSEIKNKKSTIEHEFQQLISNHQMNAFRLEEKVLDQTAFQAIAKQFGIDAGFQQQIKELKQQLNKKTEMFEDEVSDKEHLRSQVRTLENFKKNAMSNLEKIRQEMDDQSTQMLKLEKEKRIFQAEKETLLSSQLKTPQAGSVDKMKYETKINELIDQRDSLKEKLKETLIQNCILVKALEGSGKSIGCGNSTKLKCTKCDNQFRNELMSSLFDLKCGKQHQNCGGKLLCIGGC